MANYYEWFKALHIISVISWMAGMFYLPRLYVYHSMTKPGSEMDKTFQTMEYRLFKIIMNPSMISTYVFGIITSHIYGFGALGKWFHIKMLMVIILTILHGIFARWRKDFVGGKNTRSDKFYRFINEIPVVLMIVAVFMVVLKPFD